MKITMLGTGHAVVTNCYNTCFAMEEKGAYFLVDAGGGNGILKALEKGKIPLSAIHDVFVSHAHTDHMLGVIWVLRLIGSMMLSGTYEGELRVYCHKELSETIQTICRLTLPAKLVEQFGRRIRFVETVDGDVAQILDSELTFFDIASKKEKQFGFFMKMHNGKRLLFCGDEPLKEEFEKFGAGCDWMMHEAFCLYEEREIFQPYEKHHSTVKDACELAQRLGVQNLILYHTEDSNLAERKARYTAEGSRYFSGKLLVPEDGEVIVL